MGSHATLTQIGTGNTGDIVQGGLQYGKDMGSTATLTQRGTVSAATIAQGFLGVTSGGNEATITQTADANSAEAFVYQGFGGNSTSTHDKATITQGGSGDNYAQVVQGTSANVGTANSNDNVATITQADGTSNSEALIDQGRDAGGSAQGNTATIDQQSGNLNKALVSQGRAEGGPGSFVSITTADGAVITGASSINSVGSVTQSGTSNKGLLYQAGTSNGATMNQNGNSNEARLYQNSTGATGNDAMISQTGNGNILRGSATGSFAQQSGDANTLNVTQNSTGGSGHTANVNQMGMGNTITQTSN